MAGAMDDRIAPASAVDGGGFAAVLTDARARTDGQVADLIEADGRQRIRDGLPVTLERYLEAISDLERREVPLDAAIDVCLRAEAGASHSTGDAVERLVASYPGLENAIREAAALSHAVLSTSALESRLRGSIDRPLPWEIGPPIEEGGLRFRLERKLGAGASASVYLGADRRLSDEDHAAAVAVKVRAGDLTEAARYELAAEARKARRIDHPNVTRVLDRGLTADGEEYIVYEYVDGGTLESWFAERDRSLTLREVAMIGVRLARGLAAMHAAGLIHCDLKPSNVLMTRDGQPKITDFGLSLRAGDDHDEHAGLLGNLAFMSPEQYRREPGALRIESDIYALGGILYHLLTASLPNGGTPEEVRAVHDRATGRRAAPDPRELRPGIDADLAAIVMRCLAPGADQRHESAAQVADDLDAWLHARPIAWTSPSAAKQLRLWILRSPYAASLATLALLGLLAAVGSAIALAIVRTDASLQSEVTAATGEHMKRYEAQMADPRLTPAEKMEIIWLLDFVADSELFGQRVDLAPPHELRITAARGIIDDLDAAGRGEESLTILWKTAYGLWQVEQRRHDPATTPMLREAYAIADRKFGPDDPITLQLEAISLASAVKDAWYAASEDQPLTGNPRIALLGLVERLEGIHAAMARGTRDRARYSIVHRALSKAYHPRLLDDPAHEARYPPLGRGWEMLPEHKRYVHVDSPPAAGSR